MNIAESLAKFIENNGFATLGQDLFIGGAPSSNQVIDCWWIVNDGGSPLSKNSSGEMMKTYSLSIFRRDQDYKTILDSMFQLEEQLNCDRCSQLESFDTVDIEASVFPVDNDLDNEGRKIGLLQATITTYKECQ